MLITKGSLSGKARAPKAEELGPKAIMFRVQSINPIGKRKFKKGFLLFQFSIFIFFDFSLSLLNFLGKIGCLANYIYFTLEGLGYLELRPNYSQRLTRCVFALDGDGKVEWEVREMGKSVRGREEK